MIYGKYLQCLASTEKRAQALGRQLAVREVRPSARAFIVSVETAYLPMIAAGAFGLGLVSGWAVEFLGWSWASASYRAAMAAGLTAVLIGAGTTAVAVGLTGFLLGAGGHQVMLEAIRRRRI